MSDNLSAVHFDLLVGVWMVPWLVVLDAEGVCASFAPRGPPTQLLSSCPRPSASTVGVAPWYLCKSSVRLAAFLVCRLHTHLLSLSYSLHTLFSLLPHFTDVSLPLSLQADVATEAHFIAFVERGGALYEVGLSLRSLLAGVCVCLCGGCVWVCVCVFVCVWVFVCVVCVSVSV
jgi:hypothetical protein